MVNQNLFKKSTIHLCKMNSIRLLDFLRKALLF